MGNKIILHLDPDYDISLLPVPGKKHRIWWEDNTATRDHARHCLPLNMANSLGHYILSPGTFVVKWNGDTQARAIVTAIDKCSHFEVDNHAAFGSFTIQPKFIPRTSDPGDFVYVKGIPNERGLPYVCMEGIIEAWWSVANFGLVYLLNQPGEFLISKGQPIAQFFMFPGAAGAVVVDHVFGYPSGHDVWQKKRDRPGYRKDLDYFKGLTAGGDRVDSHVVNWKDAKKFQ